MKLNNHSVSKTQAAFTLVEVLVVIGIIVILASIAIPVYASTKLGAHKTTSMSNMAQLGKAFALYAVDYDDRIAHGIPLVWDDCRYCVPADLEEIAKTAPVVEPLVRPYGLTPALLRAANDPGFGQFGPPTSYFEFYGTSYGLRRRATLMALPFTHYDYPSAEPFAYELGQFYDSRQQPPLSAKVNVLYMDQSVRYTTQLSLFNAMREDDFPNIGD